MSHELTESTVTSSGYEAAFFNTTDRMRWPWHGLGHIEGGTADSQKARELAGLTWEPVMEPLEHWHKGQLCPCDDMYAVVRNDNLNLLGVVGTKYSVVDNTHLFEFFDEILQDRTMKYDAAFSLFGGRRVVVTAKANDMIINGDAHENTLMFSSRHDGKGSFDISLWNGRVVCWNTYMASMRRGTATSFRHTHNVKGRIKWAVAMIQKSLDNILKLKETLEILADKDGSISRAMEMFEILNPKPERLKFSDETAWKRSVTAWENKQSGFFNAACTEFQHAKRMYRAPSLYEVWQSVTRYTDHVEAHSRKRTNERALVHIEETGQNKKEKALRLLTTG